MTQNPGLMRIAPPWVTNAKSHEEQIRRMGRMLLRQCAVWYHPSGSIQHLSRGLGLGRRTLSAYMTQERLITPELAIKIESLIGRHVVTREAFRPDMFLPADAAEPAAE